jgi:hypothetical protein
MPPSFSKKMKSKSKSKGKSSKKTALHHWVAFIKKVQKEEGLSYKDAMQRAKQRKDKGENWKGAGGNAEDGMNVDTSPLPEINPPSSNMSLVQEDLAIANDAGAVQNAANNAANAQLSADIDQDALLGNVGGRRRSRGRRRGRGRGRGRKTCKRRH